MLSARPITDLVVLELGKRDAVAVAGSLLAGAGARVVRTCNEAGGFRSSLDALLASGKEELTLDPDRIAEQAARADILLMSSDVDHHIIAALSPRAGQIVCDITAGLATGEPLNEWQLQAVSGLVHTTGWPDKAPNVMALPIVNEIAGFYAAIAVLARVLAGDTEPARIDISMLAASFVTLNSFLAGTLQTGGHDPARVGNRHTAVAPWNSYPTRDGAIIICAGNRPQWQALCALMGRPDLDKAYPNQDLRLAHIDIVDGAIASWTSQHATGEIETLLVKAGIAAGRILAINDYPDDENLRLRGLIGEGRDETGRTIYQPNMPRGLNAEPAPKRAPGCAPALNGSNAAPLTGLRVVEMGQFTTAPLCGRILAALGAEVIKIEKPGGDEQRHWQGGTHAIAETFWLNNTGKQSLCLNLANAGDRDCLSALLSAADLLVENFKPGTLAKFGFDEERLNAINPNLVHCAISGFGAHSAYPGRPGFDMVIQGMAGFMSAIVPGAEPIKSGISTADMMGALAGVVASLGALSRRKQNGGTFIDLSMQDVTAWLTAPAWNGGAARDLQPVVLDATDGYVAAERAPETPLPSSSRAEMVKRLAELGIASAQVATIREAAFSPPLNTGHIWRLFDQNGQILPILGLPFTINGRPFLKFAPAPAVEDELPRTFRASADLSPVC